jgi:ABC-type sulfate transport system permease component
VQHYLPFQVILLVLCDHTENTSSVTCDNILGKVQVVTCCVDALTTVSHVIVLLFLYHCSWYDVLGYVMHLCTLLVMVWQLPTRIPTFSAGIYHLMMIETKPSCMYLTLSLVYDVTGHLLCGFCSDSQLSLNL